MVCKLVDLAVVSSNSFYLPFFQFIHVGLSDIEIGRFSRKKLDFQFRCQHGSNVNFSSDAAAQVLAKEMGPLNLIDHLLPGNQPRWDIFPVRKIQGPSL